MSSTTITREQLQIALLRYGEWVENKFNESYNLHLKSEAEDLVFWSRFRSRITFGLCKVKTMEKAFAEAKENYGNWNRLEGPDFFYHYSWRKTKASYLSQLLGSDDHFRHDHNERHGVHLDQNGQARHVLKIHMPKGTQAMSVKKHTFNPGEHEVLLNRGHDLEIHHKPTLHIDKNGDKYHVWHAKIVGHSPANLDGEDL